MRKSEILKILKKVMPTVDQPYDVPTKSDWIKLESKFGTVFPQEFVDFVELLTGFEFPGDFYNVNSTENTNGNDYIGLVYDMESSQIEWPKWFVPFYGIGNGDYFGLDSREGLTASVHYWYHDRLATEPFKKSFWAWIENLESLLGEMET